MGHIINRNGLHTDADKVTAILNLALPRSLKEARRFLGLSSWYRRFIKDAARISAPLHKLLRKKANWEWTPKHQKSFDELKRKLTTLPVLACPDWTKPLVLQTDASIEGLGVVLSQPDGEGLEKMNNPSGRLARWAMELSQWDILIWKTTYLPR